MPGKRALIVDDSKSARVILARMLEQYAIGVDMAESAEEAIEYLKRQRPDAIFMDHQMPGMDGLQAVKVIKNDPRTATIPIMMYTSQAGEVYVGQARALGAVGVWPKQIAPVDVAATLDQLRLLPDRPDRRSPSAPGIEGPATRPGAQELAAADPTPAPAMPVAPPGSLEREVHAAVEPLLRAHLVEVRRLLASGLEAISRRAAETREVISAHPADRGVLVAPEPPPSPRSLGWVLVAAIAIGALALAIALLWRQGRELDGLRERVAAAERAAVDARVAERPSAGPAELPAAPAPAPAVVPDKVADSSTPARVSGIAAPEAPGPWPPLHVAYGETPLAGPRLDALKAAVTDLLQRGASGTIEVTSYVGDFCLAGNATDGYSLAPDDVPAKTCDLTGNPHDDALRGVQRESRAFIDFVDALPAQSHGALTLVTHDAGRTKPLAVYPPAGEATAAEWNAAAAANQRVEISFVPRGPSP